MNKLLIGILFAFVWTSVQADDLKVADDFESGDLVSADTFNQIFDTLEKINRTVVDTDLVGVWSCSAVHISSSLDATGWTQKGFLYELTGAQVNFTASSASTSLESAYSFTTSSPSPFYRRGTNTSETGTYILYKGMLLMKGVGSTNNIEPYKVEIVSNTRVIFTPLGDGGNNPESIVCDSATAVPAAPTSPTIAQDGPNKTISVAWTDASSDETGFKIYRKLSTESEAKLVATQTAVTYSDTEVTDGQTAYYHVIAYNDNGESAKSKAVSITADFVNPTVLSVVAESQFKQWPLSAEIITGDGLKLRTTCNGDCNPTFQLIVSLSEQVKLSSSSSDDGERVSITLNGSRLDWPTNLNTYWSTLLSTTTYDDTVVVWMVKYLPNASYSFTFDPKGLLVDKMGNPFTETFSVNFTTGNCPTNSTDSEGRSICP